MSFYGTEAKADTYHTARGNSTWTGDSDAKETALLRGSEYIDHNFRSSFPGYRAELRDQTREWPRAWAFDYENNAIADDEIPIEVEEATYEAALRELTDPGSLFPDFTPGQQTKREKIGPIEVEYTSPQGLASAKVLVTRILGILHPVLTGRPNSSVAGVSVRG